jgi:hypothetical protein
VEREWGWVKGRGALLGPEESGQLSCWRDGLVFLGRFHTGIFADLRCGCVAGAGSHQTPGDGVLKGVYPPEWMSFDGSGGQEPVILPVF